MERLFWEHPVGLDPESIGLDSRSGQTSTQKLIFKASLLDARHGRDSLVIKSASFFVASLKKALNTTLLLGC